MRRLRFYYWIVQTFLKKHGKVIIPAALVGAVSFTQMGRIIALIPAPKETLYIGRVGSYNLTNLPRDIQYQISDGLTRMDASGKPVPALAQDWKVIDEGKTYIFTLKPNLTWHDGSVLNSSDINYTITDVTSEIIDDRSVVFRLKEPYSPFPTIVSQPLFKRIQRPFAKIIERSSIVGTAEFSITDLTFKGNNLDQLILESPTQTKIYRFYDTERAALLAFKLAEIDIIEDLTSPAEMKNWGGITIDEKINYQRYVVVFFNTRDANLSDKSIRQALTYTLVGKPADDTRALSPLSVTSWAYNPKVKTYDYSVETATELMQNKKTDFVLELSTTPAYTQLAEQIKQSWEQLGLTVTVKVVNQPDTSNYQALLIGQQIPTDPDQYLLWHSTQQTNITGYQSAKVDKLLEDARKELDQQNRKELYLDFQRFLVEDTPAAFLFYLKTYSIKRG